MPRFTLHLGKLDVEIGKSLPLGLAVGLLLLPTLYFPHVLYHPSGTLRLLLTATVLGGICLSVLLHSLAHFAFPIPLPGRRSLSLALTGEVLHNESDGIAPLLQVLRSLAGPAASLVVSLALLFTAALVPQPLRSAVSFLGGFNYALLAFSLCLVPPLDGGKAFQALMQIVVKDRSQAARLTSEVARDFTVLLGVAGLVAVFLQNPCAIIFLLLAFYLYPKTLAHSALRKVEGAMHGILVNQVMVPLPFSLPDWTVLDSLSWAHQNPTTVFATHDLSGSLTGILPTIRALRSHKEGAKLREIAIPVEKFTKTTPQEPLSTLFSRLLSNHESIALVEEKGRVVAMVTTLATLRALHLASVPALN